MIPLIQLDRQFQSIKKEIMNAFERVVDSGHYILGNEGAALEQELAHFLGVAHPVAVANGTDALVLALRALEIGPGDEVITTPFTFFATAEAIARVGATPVFSDIEAGTYNLDPALLEEKITSKTKAIIPVHLFGKPCAMKEINEIAKRHQLYVIEDACQAFGADIGGKRVGTFGDIGCFSFFPTKNLGTLGDGGLVVTADEDLAKRIRKLRHHGSTAKYYHDEIGYNSRLDEIHAAILRVALKKIDHWNEQRRKKAAVYAKAFQHSTVGVPMEEKEQTHIYHLYNIEVEHQAELSETLAQQQIASGVYYPLPLHLQDVFAGFGYKKGDFPVAEQTSERLLAIPMHPFLTSSEQEKVIAAILAFEQRKGGSRT
ncbi:DegT/DnrJ/EryC1/StrS family aminotransferase [Halalkalibacter oceani]|uniref:DegT/DnrJ/EryC1/StrS family aminotransferase n=1 Tax=Halalkalibacter oceani TaxID=1653776 RepID=UPI0033936DAB